MLVFILTITENERVSMYPFFDTLEEAISVVEYNVSAYVKYGAVITRQVDMWPEPDTLDLSEEIDVHDESWEPDTISILNDVEPTYRCVVHETIVELASGISIKYTITQTTI